MTTPRITAALQAGAAPIEDKARTGIQVYVKTHRRVQALCVDRKITMSTFVDAVLNDALDQLEETEQ